MNVLVIGSCVLDIYHKDNLSYALGGDAANQSIMLSAFDTNPYLVSLIGKDEYTDLLTNTLISKKVNTDYLSYTDQFKTTVSHVYYKENNDRYFVVEGGAHRELRKKHIHINLDNINALSIASLFSIQYLQEDGLLEILQEAKARNIITFADTSKDRNHIKLQGIEAFLPYIDYFMPSLDEAMDFMDTQDKDKIIDILLQKGCKHILLKMGEDGIYYADYQTRMHIPAIHVDVKDTTGCGDNFVAAFISSICHNLPLKHCIENAIYAGSTNALYDGANNSPLHYFDLPHH